MNADAFRHFYNYYHFAANRKIWDHYVVPLSEEQFLQKVYYSYGSVRDQIVHIISCDDTWFRALRDIEIPAPLNPADFGIGKASVLIGIRWSKRCRLISQS